MRNAGWFRRVRGDYARVLFHFCTRGCGCVAHPAFRAPSLAEGRNAHPKLGRASVARSRSRIRTMRGCLKVESGEQSEAKHGVASSTVVITGLAPVIHALLAMGRQRRGWQGQVRPRRSENVATSCDIHDVVPAQAGTTRRNLTLSWARALMPPAPWHEHN